VHHLKAVADTNRTAELREAALWLEAPESYGLIEFGQWAPRRRCVHERVLAATMRAIVPASFGNLYKISTPTPAFFMPSVQVLAHDHSLNFGATLVSEPGRI